MVKITELVKKLSDLPLIKQLVLTFSVIVVVNLLTGLYFTTKIRDLKKLVEVMYDNPLMASTFAMSAKYRFERVDSYVRTVIFETDTVKIAELKKEINSQIEQGEEDLAVVQERALAEKSKELASVVKEKIADYKVVIEKTINQARENSKLKNSGSNAKNLLNQYLEVDIRNFIQQKLTDLTDSEAETGYTYRLDSEAKNKETVRFFYIGAAGILLVTLLLAFILSRTIASPLSRYSKTCQEISKGNYSNRVSVYGQKSEIAVLGNALNQMLDKVDEKDRSMRSLLDGLTTAVFSFDHAGNISSEKSIACAQIFPKEELKSIFQFFKNYSGLKEDGLVESLKLLWDPEVTIDFDSLATGVFPSKMKLPLGAAVTEKYILLNYKQNLNSKNQLQKIIVLADDVTEATLAQLNSAIQAERVERITRASQSAENYIESKNNFISLLRMCESILQQNTISETDLTTLKRQLHSLKGELGLMGHKKCSSQIHAIETNIAEATGPLISSELITSLEEVENEFTEQSSDVLSVLGLDSQSKMIQVSNEKISGLIRFVQTEKEISSEHRALLLQKLSALLQKPLKQFFQKYEDYVLLTAENLGKNVLLEFDSKGDEVSYAEVQHLDSIFGHLLRNSLDHDIEDSEERLEKGKSETGVITISAKRNLSEKQLRITLQDNGRGIDHRRLAEKAVQKKIWTQSQASSASASEALQLIFLSDFSTKEVVTETSGRGVGMDAVRAEIEKLGGTIELQTELGQGTVFTLNLPV